MYSEESEEEEIDQKLKDTVSKKLSKFYYNVDVTDELVNNDDTDSLEEISEDEQQDNINDLLEDDNKKISTEHADNLKQRMSQLTGTY